MLDLVQPSAEDERWLRRIAEIEPEVAHCALSVLRFRKHIDEDPDQVAEESAQVFHG